MAIKRTKAIAPYEDKRTFLLQKLEEHTVIPEEKIQKRMDFFYTPQNNNSYNVHKHMKFEAVKPNSPQKYTTDSRWKHLTNTILQHDDKLYRYFTETVAAIKLSRPGRKAAPKAPASPVPGSNGLTLKL